MNCRLLISLSILFCLLTQIKAQEAFGLYHATQVPQQNLLNPATRNKAGSVLGIPAISATEFIYYNSSFTLRDLLGTVDRQPDSAILNLNKVVDLLQNRNLITAKLNQQWLYASIRKGPNQFTFHVGERALSRLKYPKDLFDLIINGNGADKLGSTINLKSSFSVLHYREYGIGYRREVNDELSLGARIKFLKGFSIIDASRLQLNLNTNSDLYSWTATSNINIRAASTAFSATESNTQIEAADLFRNSTNPGMALDIGIVWQEHPRVTLSASLLDFGFINWKTNAVRLKSTKPNAPFSFEGLPISSTEDDFNDYLLKIRDSINLGLGLDTINASFNKALAAQFLGGVQYQIHERFAINGLFYCDIMNQSVNPAVHAGIRWQPVYWLYLTAHNTSFHKTWINPGFGTTVQVGKLQWYASTEQILGLMMPDQYRNFTFRCGVNVLIHKDELSLKRIKDSEQLNLMNGVQEMEQWGR
ncbi:MAG: hypothetical protein RL160_1073 [Bacteroidota bacterium]